LKCKYTKKTIVNGVESIGVEHVGGDMFEKVPAGCDAIFIKVNTKVQIYGNIFLELQLRKIFSNTNQILSLIMLILGVKTSCALEFWIGFV